MIRKWLVLGLAALVLSGCATTNPQLDALLLTLKTLRVQEVVLDAPTTPPVDQFPNIDGVPYEQRYQEFTSRLRPRLAELVGRPGGEKPVRMIVSIRALSVASNAGRVLASSDSVAVFSVRLEEIKTKALIAEQERIVAIEEAMKGSGNIGIIIAITSNIIDASNNNRVDKLVDASLLRLDRWLTLGEAVPVGRSFSEPQPLPRQPPPLIVHAPRPAPMRR